MATKARTTSIETRLAKLEDQVKRLEKYAKGNYGWARQMQAWGTRVAKKVFRTLKLKALRGDLPPAPPKWPPA